MTVRRSGDGKLVFETSVNRSVLFSQTGPLRLAQFCHAPFYIGCIDTKNARFLLESGLHPPLIQNGHLKRRKLTVNASTRTQPRDWIGNKGGGERFWTPQPPRIRCPGEEVSAKG